MAQFDASKDYYATLEASADAPRAEIERRYRRLAAQHHPDRGGDEERMKALNEAYGVLRNDVARDAYDEARREPEEFDDFIVNSTPAARADAFGGRLAEAALCLFAGVLLMFLVRLHYVMYLWPLALLAGGLILFGVWIAHAAISGARAQLKDAHPARRFVWAQEIVFWLVVASGACGLAFALVAI